MLVEITAVAGIGGLFNGTIKQRHEAAAEFMRQSFSDIAESRRKDDAIDSTFDDIDDLFKELEDF